MVLAADDAAANVAEEIKDGAGVAYSFLGDGAESDVGERDEDHAHAQAADDDGPEKRGGRNIESE